MEIAAGDPFSGQPCENLRPIVDALVEAGNSVLDGGFVLDAAGWRCRMARPIDIELVLQRFDLPRSLRASAALDTVLDEMTWVAIEGPGAKASRSGDGRNPTR